MQNLDQKEPIDIAEYAKASREVPAEHPYIIMIDRATFKVEQACMTGKELLQLAGKNPFTQYQLNMKLKGGQIRKIGYEDKACFAEPGVERFMTIPLDTTEGGAR